MKLRLLCAIAGIALPWFGAADAQESQTPSEPSEEVITVWGQRDREVGRAFSASEGNVDFGKFADRALLRVGELAEVVPGLAATQHSGTGKANQYFLRGFNLDHGTDFAISFDGMPLNLRSNAHGQGYLDINFIIPEIVERISYRKGVAYAGSGDFSAAGSAAFRTFDQLPESFAQAEIGENNWRRFVGGARLGELGYAALDVTYDDGPWVEPEELEKISGFTRLNFGAWSLSGAGYRADWNATDQIALRAVRAGAIDRLGDIDDDVGGESERYWINLAYQDDTLSANAYAMYYELDLFSNFTYFLDDPINGDEFEQGEQRAIYGASVTTLLAPMGAWTPRLGLETRLDRIDPIGLYRTSARQRREIVREDSIDQDSIGAFAALTGDFERLRVDLALRADAMRVDVASSDDRNSGDAEDAIVSPKAAIAWAFSENLEAYASAARGFHSNDARGATISIDPASGDPADPVPLLVEAVGAELGLRYERGGFSAAASLFALDLDSELVYVGDAGATEPSGASRRTGIELTASWSAADWLTLDGAAAATHARFRDAPGGADGIPLANDYVVTAGATIRLAENIAGSLTVRHLGPAPLIEDNSARSDASTVVNGRLSWRLGDFSLALEGLNLFDSEDADITYFYASRLPGEGAEGFEDIHFHPIPPRSFRLQARVKL